MRKCAQCLKIYAGGREVPFACIRAGSLRVGDACTGMNDLGQPDSTTECEVGAFCISKRCYKACAFDFDCPSGRTCTISASYKCAAGDLPMKFCTL
jgi:hypothetical protein